MDLAEELRIRPEEGARRLLAEHGLRLRALALRFCDGDAAAADDLCLRAFARAVERIGVRAEADAPPEDLDALPGDDPGPLAALVARTDAETVAAAVSRLPVHYRDAVLLRYWEELSLEETAVALGVPLGTAKFRLARARALLRAALEPLFGKEPR